MIIWKLGFTNAWRNLSRSSVAILSMAIAASFLTYSISLGRGYPGLIKKDYRSIIGGDIQVYSTQFDPIVPEGEAEWQYQRMHASPLTDLETFHPQLFHKGYLTRYANKMVFDTEHIAALAAFPEVRAVYPRYLLPVEQYTPMGHRSVALHGRDHQLDNMLAHHPRHIINEGRWLEASDAGKYVAVVSEYQHWVSGEPVAKVGDTLTVTVPRVVHKDDGTVSFDYEYTMSIDLAVVGKYVATTRYVQMPGAAPQSEGRYAYWINDEIHIPVETWRELWTLAGGGDFLPEQVSLLLDDVSYMENAVAALAHRFPEWTFISVPVQARNAERQGLNETFIPPGWVAVETLDTQSTVQPDIRIPLSILILCNAALVVSSNLLIMVSERKKEIGILRAVGAKRVDIVQMILCEALLITGLGGGGGFLFMRVPAFINQVSNHVHMATILMGIAGDIILVICAASSISLVFGLIPALRMAALPVVEVLQYE